MVLIRKLVSKALPDFAWIILQNLRFRTEKSFVRYSKYGELVRIRDGNLIWFTHRNRAHNYRFGLEHRGESIGHSYLLQNIDFKDHDLIIDCGANMGDLQLFFEHQELRVSYVGIEPNPLDFKCLNMNIIRRAQGLNYALWDTTSTLAFYVDSKGASSSLIEPPRYSEKILVKAVRLDSLHFDKIKLLKVEGEGAEPEILKGSRDLLNQIEFIAVDWGPERGLLQTSTRQDCLKFLTENGFNMVEENDGGRKIGLFKNTKESIL
jgi:FkbM family methyltransferase